MKSIFLPILLLLICSGCSSLQTVESSNQYEPDDSEILVDKPVWIYRTTGIQCQKNDFPTLIESIEQLERFHIEVLDFNKTYRITCFACGCPSGQIYIAQIRYSNLDNAVALNWKFYKDEIN